MATTLSNSNVNTQSDILKFQDLQAGDRYIVKGLKPIDRKYGKSYILYVVKNEGDTLIKVWSSNRINEYIKAENLEKQPKKFDFVVREFMSGKYKSMLYVEIDGFNTDSVDAGVVWL